MLKRRKPKLRRRRQTTFLIMFLIIFMGIISPFAWRMAQLRQAESVYDVLRVKEELKWWEVHGGLFNKLEIIEDASLWFELNVGGENVESKLARYQDEKHQFWLLLLNLQKGKITEAQNVLNLLDKTPLSQLGHGLISMTKGDVEEAGSLLAETKLDWETMPKQAQVLRHLTLAHAAMIRGDQQVTQNELAAAQSIDPKNPAYLTVAFDIALEERQWAKAQELSQIIRTQTWRSKNALFNT